MEGRTGFMVRRRIKDFVQKKKVKQNTNSSWKGTCSDHANRNIEDCCKKTARED
jgi:hypothetical protein